MRGGGGTTESVTDGGLSKAARTRRVLSLFFGLVVLVIILLWLALWVVPGSRSSFVGECGRWGARENGSDAVCEETSLARLANFAALLLLAGLPIFVIRRKDRRRWSTLQRVTIIGVTAGVATLAFVLLEREPGDPSACRPVDVAWYTGNRSTPDACLLKGGILLGLGGVATASLSFVAVTAAVSYNRSRPGRATPAPAGSFPKRGTIESQPMTYAFAGSGLSEAAGNFCRSCGTAYVDRPSTCTSCGWTLREPLEPPGAWIGAVVRIRWRFRSFEAVVIGEETRSVGPRLSTVLTILDSRLRTGTIEADLVRVSAAVPRVSAGMRILDAPSEAASRVWTAEVLLPHALTASFRSQDAARTFAREALSFAALDAFREAPISRTEHAWLLLGDALSRADSDAATAALIALQVDGYPGKLLLLLRHREMVSASPSLMTAVQPHVAAFSATTVGRVLAVLLQPAWRASAATRRALASDVATLLADPLVASEPRSQLRADLFTALADPTHAPERSFAELGTAPPLLSLAWAARGGPRPDLDTTSLLMYSITHPELIDDLIDAGRVDGRSAPWRDVPHLLGRVDVGSVEESELAGIGAYREAARRAYSARAWEKLDALGEVPGTGLFLALQAIEDGDTDRAGHAVALADPADQRLANAVLDVASGRTVEPADLDDPALWPAISAVAQMGAVTGSSDSLPRWAQRTLLLRESRTALFEWRWTEAADRAHLVLTLSPSDAERTEAWNLIACARFHEDRLDDALHAFRQAAQTGAVAAAVDNLMALLIETDPTAAITELSKVATAHPRTPRGASAAHEALRVWSEQPRVPHEDRELPIELRDALRAVAAAGQPDLTRHVEVINTLRYLDPEWLGVAKNTAGSTQAGTHEHKAIVARACDWAPFTKALASGLRSDPDNATLGALRDEALALVTDGFQVEDLQLDVAFAGVEMLKADVPFDPLIRDTLAALALPVVLSEFEAGEAEPPSELIEVAMSAGTRARLHEREHRELADGLRSIGTHCAVLVGAFRQEMLDELVTAMRLVAANTQGFLDRVVNWNRARKTKNEVTQMIDDSLRILGLVDGRVPDPELADQLRELIRQFERLRQFVRTGA